MNKLLKIPYYFLVCAVLGVGLLILASLAPTSKLGNFKVKIVKSGSMEPAIQTGGIVVIRPASSYGVGDVITFGKDTKTQIPTTHRIVEEKNENGVKAYVTKGDANDSPDPALVKPTDVSGKVAFTLPYLGYILDFAKKPLGFVLIVGIPAFLVILDEARKIWKEIKRMRGGRRDISGYKKSIQTPKKEKNILDLRIKKSFEFEERYQANFFRTKSFYSLKSILVLLLGAGPLVLIPLVGNIGNTVSYYNESEASVNNKLQARGSFETSPLSLRSDPLLIKERGDQSEASTTQLEVLGVSSEPIGEILATSTEAVVEEEALIILEEKAKLEPTSEETEEVTFTEDVEILSDNSLNPS